jgi:hypothetical protein
MLQQVIANLGRITGAFRGSWEHLLSELQMAQGRKPAEKKIDALRKEMAGYRRDLWIKEPFMPLTHRGEGTDFENALVVAAVDSPFCNTDHFVEACEESLDSVGLKARVCKVTYRDQVAFTRELCRPNRPFFAMSEASGFSTAGLGEEFPRHFQGGLQRYNRFFINRRATGTRTDESLPPYLIEYGERKLAALVRRAVLELPAIHEIGVEMSDEQGTLVKVLGGLAGLGGNIVESQTWTVKKGAVARLRVVLELPSSTDWREFEAALSQEIQAFGELGEHRLLFPSTHLS